MMPSTERFAYSTARNSAGESVLLPLLPIVLRLGEKSVAASGLLDSGATVNVLPFSLGLELGAVWEEQSVLVRLGGNLASEEARALLVSGVVSGFDPVRLAFAWTRAEDVPLILGQINFFSEFDICFFRARQAFEVSRKS
jgi:hypothetical protein